MPYIIRVESADSFALITRMINNTHARMHDNFGGYVEYIDAIDGLKKALEGVQTTVDVEDIPLTDFVEEKKTTKAKPSKAKKKKERETALPPLCAEHPSFKAIRSPRTDCDNCWGQYQRLNPARYASARRNFERGQRV